MAKREKAYQEEVYKRIFETLIRQPLTIFISSFHKKLHQILAATTQNPRPLLPCLTIVTLTHVMHNSTPLNARLLLKSASTTNDIVSKVVDRLGIRGDLLVITRPPISQSPKRPIEAKGQVGSETVKGSGKGDLLLGVDQTAKGFSEPNSTKWV